MFCGSAWRLLVKKVKNVLTISFLLKTNRFNAVVNIYDNVVATIYSNFFENSKLLQIAANIFRNKMYYKIVTLLQMYENTAPVMFIAT